MEHGGNRFLSTSAAFALPISRPPPTNTHTRTLHSTTHCDILHALRRDAATLTLARRCYSTACRTRLTCLTRLRRVHFCRRSLYRGRERYAVLPARSASSDRKPTWMAATLATPRYTSGSRLMRRRAHTRHRGDNRRWAWRERGRRRMTRKRRALANRVSP